MIKIFHNNFSFKFVKDNIKIYSITNKNSNFSSRTHLSIPLKTDNIDTSVLISFNKKNQALDYINILNHEYYLNNKVNFIELYETNLEDFKYIGNIIHMPIVIILDTIDNNYDIYYSKNN